MRSIQIQNSYRYASIYTMKSLINDACEMKYYTRQAEAVLNRSYTSMYIEWWLHNIGYFVTKPFVSHEWVKDINERCRHVDLEEWK